MPIRTRRHSTSGQDPLDDIERVYADFGYPSDMEPFIYYMPNDDGESSPEAMIRRFRTFVASEKERLGLKPQEHIEQPLLPAQTQSDDVMTSPDFE